MGILKKPLLTDKYTRLNEKYQHYGFIVDQKATKEEIKAEIEKVYEVQVAKIRTMRYMGKSSTRYTKRGFLEGRKAGFKKAVIELVEGQTIDFYENI
jgi:large subunit ribosomal protein L23